MSHHTCTNSKHTIVSCSLFLCSQAGRRELQGSEGEKNGITNGVNSAEALVNGSNTERPVERCPTGSRVLSADDTTCRACKPNSVNALSLRLRYLQKMYGI